MSKRKKSGSKKYQDDFKESKKIKKKKSGSKLTKTDDNLGKHKNENSRRKKMDTIEEIIDPKKMIGKTVGILSKHKKGFGFVIVEGEDDDIFIPKDYINGAMNGDAVYVDDIRKDALRNSKEGKIIGIKKRSTEEVVGTFEKNEKFGFVVPDSKKINDDIFILKKYFNGAEKGDKVSASIIKYPLGGNKAEGKITEVIAKKDEPGGDIKAMYRAYGLKETFPSSVNEEAVIKSQEVITEKEISRRKDLREKYTVTIDGADSKDFDDAVSVDILPNGNYLLGVHIADVAHYVENNGELDKEAVKRGNSVYLINQVIPMLPKNMSNGICSLNPNEERLTMTCEMEVDHNGKVINSNIFESVIKSHARLVYDDVSNILENGEKNPENNYMFEMEDLAKILMEVRAERGSLDFDLNEAHIVLDDQGVPIEITIADRRIANKMIEEFMLLANETVAKHFYELEAPFVYRVHEKPSLEKMTDLKEFLIKFGITLPGDLSDVNPKTLYNILISVKGQDYENVVNTVTLRSMQKAIYETECKGHFGLALDYYSHFTSPIRRYPDLMIHRVIKYYLNNKPTGKELAKLRKKCEEIALSSSLTERQAIELEREVGKMKMSEYMSNHIGEEFEGVISGVTNFGIYVELPNTIEGMVKFENMTDDYYQYIQKDRAVVGEHTGKKYSLGDKVKIKVNSVYLSSREINFSIIA